MLLFLLSAHIFMFLPRNSYDPILKWMARKLLLLMGIRVSVDFKEELNQSGTYLYIANHVNLFDPLLLYGYIPTFVRGVELSSHFKWPIYGWTLSRMGHIPINRVNANSAMKSLRRAAEYLQRGDSIVILPEGHRTSDGKVANFKRGSFILAKNGGRDIVPVAIIGALEISRRGSWLISPGQIILRFGKPIPERDFRSDGTYELKERCQNAVKDLMN